LKRIEDEYSMIELAEENIGRVIGRIRELGGDRIAFIALYGSVTKNRDTPLSDIDLAVFYEGNKEERFKFRMSVLGRTGDEFDVQIYQDLPLYIQKEVISYGKLLYYKEYDVVFDIYINVIKNFDDFKRHLNLYLSYLGGVDIE
jgi:predicted nucleotidyltransferase